MDTQELRIKLIQKIDSLNKFTDFDGEERMNLIAWKNKGYNEALGDVQRILNSIEN